MVRGDPGAQFAGVAHAIEACRYKGIDVWKVDLVLVDEVGADRGRVELRFPKEVGISCELDGFSLFHAVLLKTATSLEQEDGSAERASVTELSASQLALLPPEALNTNGLVVIADSSAPWGEVFAILQALRARGIEDLSVKQR